MDRYGIIEKFGSAGGSAAGALARRAHGEAYLDSFQNDLAGKSERETRLRQPERRWRHQLRPAAVPPLWSIMENSPFYSGVTRI